MKPQKWQKRPVVIEAMRMPEKYPTGVDASSDGYQRNIEAAAVLDWLRSHLGEGFDPIYEPTPGSGWTIDPATGYLQIATLEGLMTVKPGDWVVRGIAGEFYPVKDSIFRDTYDPQFTGVKYP
ncbi:hypothetical protein BJD55_gp086 [Gordonia phage Yvonnetastic]|uniref:Uncharacterized protein n=1 Tax=Gordonia phage Yvonnetastic TaxID=1821566 RepID=A0A142K997_9CAUD|nr:hypothetical protein BJD55_gp086 [Gordonia phage Yvonnetastic]AMS02680.1 hypothetical protein SEA_YVONNETASTIC_136 [Gordonia phage Yvonnetastic]WKW86113.1 hypothetical protein SEA_JONJAMES_139 [Gordonia Phage JonJames]